MGDDQGHCGPHSAVQHKGHVVELLGKGQGSVGITLNGEWLLAGSGSQGTYADCVGMAHVALAGVTRECSNS